MAGFESIGNLLAGGIDREGEFQKGRYRTAQTEQALAAATKGQQDAIRQQTENEAIAKLQASQPNLAAPTDANLLDLIVGGLGGGFSSAAEGRLKGQEFTNRGVAADPAQTALARTRALQAVQGTPTSDIDAIGSKGFVNLTDEAQKVQPLGDAFGTDVQPSTAEKNYKFAQSLPAPQQEAFNKYVRADQYVTAGGVPYQVGLTAPASAPGAPQALVAPSTVASNKGAQAGAIVAGKDLTSAKLDLPGKLAGVDKYLTAVDDLLTNPGFDTIYGISGKVDPRNYIPGTDATEASTIRNNIAAQGYQQAAQAFRGLGQLSNQEGSALKAAFEYASNPNLNERQARKAWAKVRNDLAAQKQRAIDRASRGETVNDPAAAAPASTPTTNSKGWTLHVDGEGNKAYVSPDGQSFEEVQ